MQRQSAPVAAPTPGRTVLLDGGCGLELKRRKAEGRDVAYDLTLFSTAALRDSPAAVGDLHRDFIRAGCQVITTASYAVTRFYLDQVSQSHLIPELAARSLRLAREAVAAEGATGSVAVAASVPPLGESYKPNPQGATEATAQYTELLQALRGADICLAETLASLQDAETIAAACSAVWGPRRRLWLSFCPARSSQTGAPCIRDGASPADAIRLAERVGAEAVLFNCATPEVVGLAVREAVAAAKGTAIAVGGYANFWEEMSADMGKWTIKDQESGHGRKDHGTTGLQVRRDLTDELYAEAAQRWVGDGATIVGGCCGIGPNTIAHTARRLSIGRAPRLTARPAL
eukprot:TRINITY_DN1037_c0_g2_i1.p1 TRINITY_DN1037_c0_g2~~TRINITY_DN1037_c0_g2_i1.p1  ORF type:complete len:374 (+),score=102.25 TRINITY_DN1037_c0_g2_i1:88-1122(+)